MYYIYLHIIGILFYLLYSPICTVNSLLWSLLFKLWAKKSISFNFQREFCKERSKRNFKRIGKKTIKILEGVNGR
jgi:hypothetical protein